MYSMSISKRIREVIEESGIAKLEVARRMGASPNTIHELLRSDERCEGMSIESARKLAKALEVSLAWLLEGRKTQSVAEHPDIYEAWLETPEGRSATPEERSFVRSYRSEAKPTVAVLSLLLVMNRLQQSSAGVD